MIGFANAFFLAGLAAIGLPIAIHFLTRARPRVIRFPPYRLLFEAGSGRQALYRLRTWIVLAVRTIFIAALVLLFAKPFLRSPGTALEPGAARRVALVLDASLSMRAVRGNVTLFTMAKAQAADVLRTLEEGSLAGVVLIGSQPRPLLPALSRNLAALHEALAAAEAGRERGDPAAALTVAARMLDGKGEIFVFSDFQRTNWAAADFSALRGTNVYLRPVVERPAGNVGLVSVEKSPEEPIEGEAVDLVCRLFNASPDKRLETVRLELAGISHAVDVQLKPYSSGTAAFSFSLPHAGGEEAGMVAIQGDDLEDDNRRFFGIRARRALKVLLMSDAPGESPSSGAFLLRTALAPSSYAATGIEVNRRVSQDVDRGALETSDGFFFVTPVRPTGETIEIVARRVIEGAHLVCFLDGPTAQPLVNALGGASNGAIAPPFTLLRAVAEKGEWRPFGEAVTTSGPLALFHSPDPADLKSIRFGRHFFTEDAPKRVEEILIRFEDGSVALSLSPAGRGAAAFANLPLAPDGSTLGGSPLFPALLHELVRAMRRTAAAAEPSPGEAWNLEFARGDEAAGARTAENPAAGAPSYRVAGPGGAAIEHTIVASGRSVRLAMPPVGEPGHYVVWEGDRRRGLGVVNVDPRETDTRPIDVREVVERGALQDTNVAVVDSEGGLVHAGTPTALWPHLAALAAVALASEMAILAFWRRKRERPLRPFGVAAEFGAAAGIGPGSSADPGTAVGRAGGSAS